MKDEVWEEITKIRKEPISKLSQLAAVWMYFEQDSKGLVKISSEDLAEKVGVTTRQSGRKCIIELERIQFLRLVRRGPDNAHRSGRFTIRFSKSGIERW